MPDCHISSGGERAVTHITPRTKDKGNQIKRKRIISIACLLALCLCALSLSGFLPIVTADEAAAAIPLRSARIVQYVMDADHFPLTSAQAANIDQINYAHAMIQSGQVDVSHMQGLDSLRRYLANHPHIVSVLTVGDMGPDRFSEACSTAAGRQLLANSALQIMDQYGFSGIEVDWAYPGVSTSSAASADEDVEHWYELLSILRAGLDERQHVTGKPYILSVTLSAGSEQAEAVDGDRLNSLIDQAVIQSHDLRGFDRMTGHHAGLYPDGETELSGAWAVQSWLNTGLAPDKLLLGVPQYGRMWRKVASTGNGLHARAETSGNKLIAFDEISNLLQDGYTRHYDESAQSPWLFNGENFVSYDDAQSVQAKAAYIAEYGLLGTALRHAGYDLDGMLPAVFNDAWIVSPAPDPENAASTANSPAETAEIPAE